jgi:post-segregation antitoxin (ccd killing protein)
MKMTIYLPDELAERVKAQDDLNVSGVCQEALDAELSRRASLAKLDEGMERVMAYKDGVKVSFVGRRLVDDGRDSVYLTGRYRIAVVGVENQLSDYDGLDLAEIDGVDQYLIAQAANTLGDERVVELDI